jgi:hypothetical protein
MAAASFSVGDGLFVKKKDTSFNAKRIANEVHKRDNRVQ